MAMRDTSACVCSRCSFCCTVKAELVKHVFESHCFDPLFTFPCPLGGCPHTFKLGSTYSSYQSHVRRKHHNWKEDLHFRDFDASSRQLQSSTEQTEDGELAEQTEDGELAEQTEDGELAEQTEGGELAEQTEGGELVANTRFEEFKSPDLVSRSAAQFLLTLKEKYRVTQSVVDFAVGSVNQMVSHVCRELHHSVVRTLQENDIAIPAALSESIAPIEPFKDLVTEYQQSKYYREHLGLVVSLFT